MESSVGFVAGSEGVGGKRPALEDGDVLKEGSSSHKRSRGGSGRGFVGDVKKVAEMVLVLAAMGKMRGGKGPTDVEKELMVEARDMLAMVCEGFAPKDVFPRDAFGGVIEDLGLNKLKEQKLGFRPPKMSIAEKLLVSKRKLEKAENFSLPSAPHSTHPQGYPGSSVEGRNVSHPVRKAQPDKSSHMTISSGSLQSASSLANTTPANSSSLPYQLPTSEIRPIGSNALPSSHLGSAALPRVDRPHLRSDGRTNGSSHPPQVQVNYSTNSMRAPTWGVQQQLPSKSGSDNRAPVNMSFKVEGAAAAKSGLPTQSSRTVAPQTIGPPSHGTNHVQALSMGNTHAEVGRIVQKLIQPRVSERPTWNPPSRDYMNKPLTCQMCLSTVTEIDSILICDACEKGYHLKCLQTTSQKGVPRGEWHCGKCLALSNGKPLPPKYGRVMRNVNSAPKISSNSTAVSTTSSKRVGASDEKVGQQKVMANGNTTLENAQAGVANNYSHASGSEGKKSKNVRDCDNDSSRSKVDEKVLSGTYPNSLLKTSSSASISSVNALVEKTSVDKMVEMKSNSSSGIKIVPESSDRSQRTVNATEESPLKQSLENHDVFRDLKDSHGDEVSSNTNQLKEQEIVPHNPTETAASDGAMNQGRSSDGLHAVNWVGDPVQVLDEKTYYASCCIKGHLYKPMDHVLIRFGDDKLVPSKLQAMWEDKNTTMKWVSVNQCYFPGDLPESVGRPCGLEGSEVYESTCGRSFMAGLIESPCEVLPPRRFAEESERRTRIGKELKDQLPPLYLCKWIYDEAKGLFRDISC